jgi:hypothetical protein
MGWVYNCDKMKPRHAYFLAVSLLAVTPLWAHHGSTGFDQNKPVHFVGRVSQVDWVNPHVVIHLEVAGEGGTATWLVNTLPPNTAKRQGFAEDLFSAGTELTVDGYQAKDGSNHVNGTSIVFKDGKKITSPDCFTDGQFCYKGVLNDGKPSGNSKK